MVDKVVRFIVDSSKAKAGAEQYETSIKKVVRSTKDADRALTDTEKSFGLVGRGAAQVATQIATLAGAFASIQGLRVAATTIGNFERKTSELAAVTGLDRLSAEFKDLTATARELGATTEFSATQAADALLELSRGGLTAAESLATIKPVLDLAIVGNVELSSAAEITIATLRQFGLSAEEAGRAADVLVKQSNTSATNVSGLAEALKVVGPILGSLGVSIEEGAAAIGVLANNAIKGSDAGTGLRTALSSLLTPSDDALRIFERLGVALEEVDPAQVGVIDSFKRLGEAGLSVSDSFLIFGNRGATVATILAKNAEQARILKEQNDQAAGSNAKAAAIIGDNLVGAVKGLNSAFEELILSTGDSGLLSSLRTLVDFAADVTRELAGTTTETNSGSIAVKAFGVAIDALTGSLQALIGVQIVSFLSSVVTGGAAATKAISVLTAVLRVNPFVLAATAIAGVVSALSDFDLLAGTAAEEAIRLNEQIEKLDNTIGKLRRNLEAGIAKELERAAKSTEETNEFFRQREEFVRSTLTSAQELAQAELDRLSGLDEQVEREKKIAEFQERRTQLALLLQDGSAESLRKEKAAADADVKSYTALLDKIRELKQEQAKPVTVERDYSALDARFAAISAQGSGSDQIVGYRQALNLRESLVGLGQREAQIEQQVAAYRTAAIQAFGGYNENVENLTATYKEQLETVQQLEDAEAERNRQAQESTSAQEQIDAIEKDLALQKDLLKFSEDRRRVEEDIAKFRELANKAYGAGTPEAEGSVAGFRSSVESIEATRAAEEQGKAIGDAVANPVRGALNDAFRTLFEGGEIDGKALGAKLGADIAAGIVDEIIVAPIAETISGIISGALKGVSEAIGEALAQQATTQVASEATGSILFGLFAKGGVVDDGNVLKYGSGGVAGQPTYFPVNGGKVGLLGEEGPEGILPLKRTKSGDLGVAFDQSSMGGGVQRIVHFNIVAHDADSFRKQKTHMIVDEERLSRRLA